LKLDINDRIIPGDYTMIKPTKLINILILVILTITMHSAPATQASVSVDKLFYLPLVSNEGPATRKINIPDFGQDDIRSLHYSEMAIFWFGKIAPPENYADIRIAYNNEGLGVSLSIFDRRLWYDTTPSSSDLSRWDGVTLYISKSGILDGNTYRFTAQLNDWEPRQNWQLSEKGSSSGWVFTSIPFSTATGVRWEDDPGGFNNNSNNRGAVIHFSLPFSSLGLTTEPTQGTTWRIALVMHDRDNADGSSFIDSTWPENIQTNRPQTWGRLGFGMPSYTPPSIPTTGTITIRHKLNNAIVPDAAVGGTTGNLCPGDPQYIWSTWPNANFGSSPDMNIQNQSDLVDWPCFSKYFINFPLNSVPANKIIKNATLILYHWGNSGTINLAQPSYIHVFTTKEPWSESSITWNNAPLAQENVSIGKVEPTLDCDWPCNPRSWDVTLAVIEAYEKGTSLGLALYSSDSPYHSGKFFTTSDTGDWNATGRPTLIISWGDP
jgi:hypothetical protein